jgi:hypothetical protein
MYLLADWGDADADAAHLAWVRNLFSELRPAMKPGVCVNFMSGDDKNRLAEAYGGLSERLVAVKTRYDPSNFFRLNQNIHPHIPA